MKYLMIYGLCGGFRATWNYVTVIFNLKNPYVLGLEDLKNLIQISALTCCNHDGKYNLERMVGCRGCDPLMGRTWQ